MSSAWGLSWGLAWGVAWGAAQVLQGGGTPPRERHDDRHEAIEVVEAVKAPEQVKAPKPKQTTLAQRIAAFDGVLLGAGSSWSQTSLPATSKAQAPARVVTHKSAHKAHIKPAQDEAIQAAELQAKLDAADKLATDKQNAEAFAVMLTLLL
jgi:hypothetical protein